MIDVLKNCYVGEKLQNDATKMDQINIKWIKHGSVMVNVPPWTVNVLIFNVFDNVVNMSTNVKKKFLKLVHIPKRLQQNVIFQNI